MKSTLLFSTLATIALAGTAFADTNQVGVNAAIRNSVQEKATSEGALHPAVLRASVHLGDSVVSGDRSALQVLLLDQSVFTVGANASVTIDKFVYDPNRGTSDIAASVAKGAFRFMSGHSLSGFGHNAINTPVATIGVRGTAFEGVVGTGAVNVLAQQPNLPPFTGDPSGINVIVLNGPGHGAQGFDKPGAIDVTAGGETVTIDHPGQAVIIWGPGQKPYGPIDFSDGAFAALSDMLRTTPGEGGDQSDFPNGSAGDASGDTLDVGPTGGDPYNQKTGGMDLPLPPSDQGG
jgi:hypothetical protein